ncbi:MAG: hypothetical protein ACM3JB_14540 [Acidobacteriaceae bacterium]
MTELEGRFATSAEIEAVFDVERDNLRWIAYAITGNKQLAEQSLVDARGLQPTATGVFRDWLVKWAESATARVAATNIGESLREAAKKYANWSCDHPSHDISHEESSLLARLSSEEIVDGLDPLARTILVLRSMQRASISDCTILLTVSRRAVLSAYCHALWWLRAHSVGT